MSTNILSLSVREPTSYRYIDSDTVGMNISVGNKVGEFTGVSLSKELYKIY